MKPHVLAVASVALAVAASVASAQYIETVIPILDSIHVPGGINALVYDSVDNRVFVGSDSGIVVFDALSYRKLAGLRIPVCRIAYNPVRNKIYAAGHDSLRILDARTYAVTRTLPFRSSAYYDCEPSFAYNSVDDKMYFAQHDAPHCVAVIDGATDSLLRLIDSPNQLAGLLYVQFQNRLYVLYLQQEAGLVAFDGSSDTAVHSYQFTGPRYKRGAICYNPLQQKLYCGYYDGLMVVDLHTDSTKAIFGLLPLLLTYCSAENRVYCSEEYYHLYEMDCQTDSWVRVLRPQPNGCVVGLHYDPRWNKLWGAGDERNLFTLDCATDSFVAYAEVISNEFERFCSSPGGTIYAGSEGAYGVTVVDGQSNSIVATVFTSDWYRPRDLCYVPARDRIYCLGDWGTLSVIEGSSGTLLGMKAVGVTSRELVSCGRTGKVYMGTDGGLDVISGSDTVTARIALRSDASPRYWSESENKLYARMETSLAVVDVEADTVLRYIQLPRDVGLVTADTLRDVLYVSGGRYGSPTGTLTAIDMRSDSVIFAMGVGHYMSDIAVSATQNRLYCHDDLLGIVVVDATTRLPIDTLAAPPGQHGMVWNQANDKVYCRTGGDTVLVIDCPSSRVSARLKVGPGHKNLLAFGGSRARLYCACQDSLYVIDGRSDSVVARLPAPHQGRSFTAGNPNLGRVYVISSDSTVTVIRDTTLGIADGRTLTGQRHKRPTVVRGVLSLPRDMTEIRPGISDRVPRPTLLDISGRNVLDLLPGPNDVRHLASGVYFIRAPSAASGKPSAITKVIITR